ncbi:MAG: flagellar FliJ family protein [Terriglobales bacterium]
MAFRFTLDAVLRFRESVEHSEEAVLHRIVQEIAEAELELLQVEGRQNLLRERRERDLTGKLPAVYLLEIAEQESDLQKVADVLRLRLQQLEAQRIKQLAVYQAAHQDREVLSELRKRQRQAHQLNQKRQEQRTLDDLFLVRGKGRD